MNLPTCHQYIRRKSQLPNNHVQREAPANANTVVATPTVGRGGRYVRYIHQAQPHWGAVASTGPRQRKENSNPLGRRGVGADVRPFLASGTERSP
jgi:hypothetical protein